MISRTRSRGWRAVVVTAAVALLASACASGAEDAEPREDDATTTTVSGTSGSVAPPTTVASVTDRKPWTVLAYSMADTDLEEPMMADVNEMIGVGSNEHVNISALVDRSPEYGETEVLGVGDWVGAKLLDIEQGAASVERDLGEINLGDPQVLTNFIAEGISRFPADNYMLVISDHGASWPGLGPDDSGEDMLTLPELDQAITTGLDAAGVEKLAILGFDACLMSTYEVASTLAPLADRMIASQELEPGHGWDYASLELLRTGAPVTADELGSAILDGYRAQAKAEDTEASITLSLTDLTKISALDDAVNAFSRSLAERAVSVSPAVGRARADVQAYGREPEEEGDANVVDLGDLASRIGVAALDVSPQADAVVRAQNDAILKMVEGSAAIKSTGLSVYFPPTSDQFDADYANVLGDTPWRTFLAAFYGEGAAIPENRKPRFVGQAGSRPNRTAASVGPSNETVVISAELEAGTNANITESIVFYGLVEDDNSVTYLGERDGGAFTEGDTLISAEYDFTFLTLSDGTTTVPVFGQYTLDDNTGIATIDVPLVYFEPGKTDIADGQEVVLAVVVDTSTNEVLSRELYSVDESGAVGQLYAQPGGRLAAESLNVADNGEQTWLADLEDLVDANTDQLKVAFERLPSGTEMYLELVVVDFGGNEAYASAELTVP